MNDVKKIPLIASEVTGLWKSYMISSMLVSIMKYFLNHVECEEIRGVLQECLDISNEHIKDLTIFFNEEELSIPDGISDSDVNINAPRLFTDSFYLQYLGFIARFALHNYALILNHIARSDIRDYFSKCINMNVEFFNHSANVRLSMGVFIRAPRIDVPKEVQYVKAQSFIYDWFGEKRPLLTCEITHIFSIVVSNIVGRAITTGFGQVSKIKKNSDFFFEGKSVASKQIGELTSLLTDEGIPIPSTSDSCVTDSTIAPFSEKLMMIHTAALASSGIGNLGIAIADNMRSDLQAKYIKYVSEDIKYAKHGTDILIDNGWLEQPPQAIKHENLVQF
ncbi:DUF3231 family protein [Clostridium sp.]|uniref:DUF3231 family protein n=1 Tax=Clostridium sp. TaxID=1506 RepID=UPI003D6CC52A